MSYIINSMSYIINNLSYIREYGSTLYVGMILVVLFYLYIFIGAKIRNRLKTTNKRLCIFKASDRVPLANE